MSFPIQKQLYFSTTPRYTGYFTDFEDRINESYLDYATFDFDVGLSRCVKHIAQKETISIILIWPFLKLEAKSECY